MRTYKVLPRVRPTAVIAGSGGKSSEVEESGGGAGAASLHAVAALAPALIDVAALAPHVRVVGTGPRLQGCTHAQTGARKRLAPIADAGAEAQQVGDQGLAVADELCCLV